MTARRPYRTRERVHAQRLADWSTMAAVLDRAGLPLHEIAARLCVSPRTAAALLEMARRRGVAA